MKLLLAVDLSEPPSVTRAAEQLAERMDAELFVLHVFVPTPSSPIPIDPMTGFGDLSYMVYDPAQQESIADADAGAFEAFLAERFQRPVRPALLQGDPARVIMEQARELGADLIVVGKRRHSALERFLLGSVPETLIKLAELPVLVLPVAAADG